MADAQPYDPAAAGSGGSADTAGLLSDPRIAGQELSFAVGGSATRSTVTLPAAMQASGDVRYIPPTDLTGSVTSGGTPYITILVEDQSVGAPTPDGTALLFFSPIRNDRSTDPARLDIVTTDGSTIDRSRCYRADGSLIERGDVRENQLVLAVFRASDDRWLLNVDTDTDTHPTSAETAAALNGQGLLEESSLDVNVRNSLMVGLHQHLERVEIALPNPNTGSARRVTAAEEYNISLGTTDWEAVLVRGVATELTGDGNSLSNGDSTEYFLLPGVTREISAAYITSGGDGSEVAVDIGLDAATDRVRITVYAAPSADPAHRPSFTVDRVQGLRVAAAAQDGLSESEVDARVEAGVAGLLSDPQLAGQSLSFAAEGEADRTTLTLPSGGLDQSAVDGRIDTVTASVRLYYARSASQPTPPVTLSGAPPASATQGGVTWYQLAASATGSDPLWATHAVTLVYPDGDQRTYFGAAARYAHPPIPGADIADDALDSTTWDRIVDGRPIRGAHIAEEAIGYTAVGRRLRASFPPTPPALNADPVPAVSAPAFAVAGDVGKYVALTSESGYGLVDAPSGSGSGGDTTSAPFGYALLDEANYNVTAGNTWIETATDGSSIDIRDYPDIFAVRIEQGAYYTVNKADVLAATAATSPNSYTEVVALYVGRADGGPGAAYYFGWNPTTNRLRIASSGDADTIDPMPLRTYSVAGVLPSTAVGDLTFEVLDEASYSPSTTSGWASAISADDDIDIRDYPEVFAVKVEEQPFVIVQKSQILANTFIASTLTPVTFPFLSPADWTAGVEVINIGWDPAANRLLIAVSAIGGTAPMPLRTYRIAGRIDTSGAVLHDRAQTLDATQKNQARANIDAISLAEVPTIEPVGFVSYQDSQTLTADQQTTARTNIGAAAAASGQFNLNPDPVSDERVWAATDLSVHFIVATQFGSGLANEVADGTLVQRNYAENRGLPNPAVNPLPLVLGGELGWQFTGDHSSVTLPLIEVPDSLLILLTVTPTFLAGETGHKVLVDFDTAYIGLDAANGRVVLRKQDQTPTTTTMISTGLGTGVTARLAVLLTRTATNTYTVAVAASHQTGAAAVTTMTLGDNNDLRPHVVLGARTDRNSGGFGFLGLMREIAVATPLTTLTTTATGDLRNLADRTVNSISAPADRPYGVLRRVDLHEIDGAVPHGIVSYHVASSAIGQGETHAAEFDFPVESTGGVRVDIAELTITATTPADLRGQIEIIRRVGSSQFLEGGVDGEGRRVFTAEDYDGDMLRLQVRNNGPTQLTNVQGNIAGYLTSTAGDPVWALPHGDYWLERGRWYWFDRHYHLDDIEYAIVGYTGGQRGATVMVPDDVVVSTDSQHLDADGLAGDWQVYGWSGDDAGFRIWSGGGQYDPPNNAWSAVRPRRLGAAQNGTWGGIHVSQHNGSPRWLRYIRLVPKRGVRL